MKATIIRIGNSRGVRIPKPVIAQCDFTDEVEMEVRGHELVIRSTKAPRAGWDAAFRQMAGRGDDMPVERVAEPSTEWDIHEWEW
jgi:antitoxin MazE